MRKRLIVCGACVLGGLAALRGVSADMSKADEGSGATAGNEVSKPNVGAYYYPWYDEPGRLRKSKWERQTMRLRLQEPQMPMAGLYDSRDPKVISEHIEQSLRAGISFWAVSWWGPGSGTDQAFRRSILTHPEASKLKYAALYESQGRFGGLRNPHYKRWIGDLEYLKKTYFDDPHYLKVDGKPVLFIYLSRVFFRNRGEDALKQMRERFPEIYLVGDDVFYAPGTGHPESAGYEVAWAKQFDAVTAYDVYGQSVKRFGGTRKAIEYLAGNYMHAKGVANSVGTAFIPAIAPGYNDTAVRKGHPGRARYFTDAENSKEGDIFRAMIRDVALPTLDPGCGNLMMITSFNEWYEDTQIEATAGTVKPSTTDDSHSGDYFTGGQRYVDYGYLYLDILREETAQ